MTVASLSRVSAVSFLKVNQSKCYKAGETEREEEGLDWVDVLQILTDWFFVSLHQDPQNTLQIWNHKIIRYANESHEQKRRKDQ